MRLHRTAICAVACAAALGSSVAASPETRSAQAQVSARIVDGGGIQVVTPLLLPTVQPSQDGRGAGFAGNTPSLGASPVSNARLTVRAEAGEALSMAVPKTFTVVRNGGGEALTVFTNTTGQYGLAGDGVLMGGELVDGSAASVDIGGRLSLASADRLVPGPYEGLLVVVVQYN